jgi:DNA-directed RNA polymerase
MIYKAAPLKIYYFGGYYLKQTKLAKILQLFHEAVRYMTRSDLSTIFKILNFLGLVEWRVNKKVLENIEYIWSTGGGKGEIPSRYN